jgi:hypothetical protein
MSYTTRTKRCLSVNTLITKVTEQTYDETALANFIDACAEEDINVILDLSNESRGFIIDIIEFTKPFPNLLGVKVAEEQDGVMVLQANPEIMVVCPQGGSIPSTKLLKL